MPRVLAPAAILGLALTAAAQPDAETDAGPLTVAYGPHPRQVLDLYRAKSVTPTPVVFAIHGGGWVNGSKDGYRGAAKRFNDAGVSLVAINYRFVTEAAEKGVTPPVKWPLEDAARALQFVRSKAKVWNLDKTRIGATGGSAGGCSSLWLAFHDDLADPTSPDPVARESTRLFTAAVDGAQTTLDPRVLRAWMPNATYGGHAFGFTLPGKRDGAFQAFYENREKVLPLIREYSPLTHVTKDDPPVFLFYGNAKAAAVKGESKEDPTHSPLLGAILMEKLTEVGVEGTFVHPGRPHPKYKISADFLLERLTAK
jgi:acetyl esterase/lipase